MPPRYAYWTIIAGGLPTAFRSAAREDLAPTFRRIQERHPDAQMKWFARGKLWDSPEAAREALRRKRSQPGADSRKRGAASGGEVRGRDWRPGGTHRDPRQPYKDAKKARNAARRRAKFERAQGEGPVRRGGAKSAQTTPARSRREPAASRPPGKEQRRGTKPFRPRPHDPKRGRFSPHDPKRGRFKGQGTEEAPPPPPLRDPDHEPRPSEAPEPTPPPRPSEPVIQPPGPPERGRR